MSDDLADQAARLVSLFDLIVALAAGRTCVNRRRLIHEYAAMWPVQKPLPDGSRRSTKWLQSDLRALEKAGFIARNPDGETIVLLGTGGARP
jgi:hypothetical protein